VAASSEARLPALFVSMAPKECRDVTGLNVSSGNERESLYDRTGFLVPNSSGFLAVCWPRRRSYLLRITAEFLLSMATLDGGKKRRRSVEERRKIVEETLQPGPSVSRVARRHDLDHLAELG
jgi:hypothetical protein